VQPPHEAHVEAFELLDGVAEAAGRAILVMQE
jgi:hypothetical protein